MVTRVRKIIEGQFYWSNVLGKQRQKAPLTSLLSKNMRAVEPGVESSRYVCRTAALHPPVRIQVTALANQLVFPSERVRHKNRKLLVVRYIFHRFNGTRNPWGSCSQLSGRSDLCVYRCAPRWVSVQSKIRTVYRRKHQILPHFSSPVANLSRISANQSRLRFGHRTCSCRQGVRKKLKVENETRKPKET